MCKLGGKFYLGLVGLFLLLGSPSLGADAESTRAFKAALDSVGKLPDSEFLIQQNIHFCDGSNKHLYMDLIRSRADKRFILPAVIIFHDDPVGGTRDGIARELAKVVAENGFVGIPVDYRLAGGLNSDRNPGNDALQVKAEFPEQVIDAMCAIRAVKFLAADYDIIPGKIAVMGVGWGGYLAMLTSVVGNSNKLPNGGNIYADAANMSSEVRGAVTWNAPASPALLWWYLRSKNQKLVKKSTLAQLMGGDPLQLVKIYRLATPMNYLGEHSAPTFSVHGTQATRAPIEHSVLMNQEFQKKEVPYKMLAVEGVNDYFQNPDGKVAIGKLRTAIAKSMQHLRVFLGQDPDELRAEIKEKKAAQEEEEEEDDDWW